jgi:hypothetical protein
LNIGLAERVGVRGRSGVFSWAKEKEKGKPHHIRGSQGGGIAGRGGNKGGSVEDGKGDRFDPDWRRVGFGVATELTGKAEIQVGGIRGKAGVGFTQEGERLRDKVERIRHCARSDRVARG